jgi:AI-2 transport protein TqsA
VNATHKLLASFAQWLSDALLVIIFVIYLLEGQRKRVQPRRGGLVARIQGRIQRYMSIKLALSLANGVLAWGIYTLLRLDLAVVFGFIHFVLNFIPSVGPLVAVLIPLPVVLVDPKLQARSAPLLLGLIRALRMTALTRCLALRLGDGGAAYDCAADADARVHRPLR